MPKRKNFIMVRNLKNMLAPGNFSIARKRDGNQIRIENINIFRDRQEIVLKDTRTARELAKRLNQFIDAGG